MTSEAIITRRYPHPVSRVYEAWTMVEHIEQWFRPFDDVSLSVEGFQFCEGGRYSFVYTWPGNVFPVRGSFLTIKPEEVLIFTWIPSEPDPDAGKETMVSVFFRIIGPNETEVEVRHTRFPDDPMRLRHQEGWNATVERLHLYLSKHNHQPDMTSITIAQRFYELNNSIPEGRSKPEELLALLASDFVFTGPLMKVNGAEPFMAMLSQFLPFHESVSVKQQISEGNTVCSKTQLKIKTPVGGSLTVDVSEWLVVEESKIKSLTIYYDPRDFVAAFPM